MPLPKKSGAVSGSGSVECQVVVPHIMQPRDVEVLN